MKYVVWAFPIVRVKFPDVEADSQEEAMKKVDEIADFHAMLDRDGVEYAEDIDCFQVDEDNDPMYHESRWYDKHYKPL